MTRARAFSTAVVLGIGLLPSDPVASATAQYGVRAEIRSTGTLRSADERLSVRASLTAKSQVPAGGGLRLHSHVDIPFGCASDTIFENGFDP